MKIEAPSRPLPVVAPRPMPRAPRIDEFTHLDSVELSASSDLRTSEIAVRVVVPPEWSEKHVAVIGLHARDAQSRSQYTRWTEGQLTADNLNYDSASHTLTLHYRPSSDDVNEQGHTDEGFDPSRVKKVQLFVSSESGQPAPPNAVHVLESKTIPDQPLQQAADVHPLLKPAEESSGHPPLWPDQATSGVSRFFAYADLHHWNDVRDQADHILAEQNANDLHGFRLMGGLDLRHQDGQPELDAKVFPAMREFLEQCRRNGQDNLIFTLLDGAIPNPTLQKALQSPPCRAQLVEALRPFVREFGCAEVGGKRVVFDLVNEIHGTPGTEASKQQLVHDLVDLFLEEAPGARLTVGVQNFREIRFWNHLFEKYAGKPVEFLTTFHLWEDVDNLPQAGQLNIPSNTSIGITEADPNRDMGVIVQGAADKGYDWLLFWTDAGHAYDPAWHHQVLQP